MRRIPEEEARIVGWDKASLDVKNCIMEKPGDRESNWNDVKEVAKKEIKILKDE